MPAVSTSLVASAVERLARPMVRLSDDALGRPWAWGKYDSEGLRFALLLTQHELRDLAARLGTARDRSQPPAGEVERVRAQYQDAYRDLTGLFHSVRDEELDRPPAPDEWSVREVMRHIIDGLYKHAAPLSLARAAWARGDEPGEPSDEERDRAEAKPARLADRDARAIANDLFAAHRRVHDEFSALVDGDLDRPVRRWDGLMPVRFRLHRFEGHLRQHTVQVEKTLLAIGHPPTEAERLVRLVHRALGDVESTFEAGVADDAVRATAAAIDERAKGIAV